MRYRSWEDYLVQQAAWDPEKAEKSFLFYALSYELEGSSVLKAELLDDKGEKRVSRLDLNEHIRADIDGNQNREFI